MSDIEDLKTRIRSAGLRSTPGRVRVLQALAASDAPLSHDEVVELIVELALDRATIYRNLMDLADVGLLTRRDFGDHVWRFEFVDENAKRAADHPHFVCTDCGDVQCMNDVELVSKGRGVPKAVRKHKVEIQMRGVCDDCI